jgi:hypothetical protein
MPFLEVDDIPDLIASTQKDLGRMKLTDISSDIQHYRAFNQIMSAARTEAQSGTHISINILTARSDNSRFKGLYQVDGNANQDDALDSGEVPWRFSDFWWAWDENEMDINSGEARIQDYVRIKRYRAMLGWAEFIEDWFWDVPPNSSDKRTPYNMRYWLQKNVSTAGADGVAGSGGFFGNVPTGADSVAHTSVGGISPTTYSNWKNYTYKYTDVTTADLITRMRSMTRRIHFEPPMGVDYPKHAGPPRFVHYVNEEVLSALETLAETRNDNLGYDFATKGPTYARAPIVWAPKLDEDTDDPIYTLDWGAFKVVYFRGAWMKERKAQNPPTQHQVWVVWVNSRFNTICYDRRRLAVGSRAAANA